MKPGKIIRLVRILTALQSGQLYTAADLVRMMGTSRRTLFRDLNDLQTAGVPCHFDKKSNHYAIDADFFLPAPALSKPEALNLLLLAYKGRQNLNMPFSDCVLRAALKIENNLSPTIRRYCNSALQYISINTGPQPLSNEFEKTFAQLQEAVLKKRIVAIRYNSPSKQKSITTRLKSFHLLCSYHRWYVIGESTFHKAVSSFMLSRIKELVLSDKCFVDNDKFDLQEYIGRAWALQKEGRLHNIKLRFTPDATDHVTEFKWHHTQTISIQDDGSAIAEFRVDGLDEITSWILGFGDKVQVLNPMVLRQRISKIANNIVRKNEC